MFDIRHNESHRASRIGSLRAAVLGANDGLVTMSSLLLGIAATGAELRTLATTGAATLVAGAMSMAAGEYVSVSSQADVQQADLAKERLELIQHCDNEHEELKSIYVLRGLEPELADKVARQLAAHNALDAHARDELGMTEIYDARPIQAAVVSALTFAIGAIPPLFLALVLPVSMRIIGLAFASLFLLIALGAISARSGGSSMLRSICRVTFWGVCAMIVTFFVGTQI